MITVLTTDALRAARGFELGTALLITSLALDGVGTPTLWSAKLYTWDPESEAADDDDTVIAFTRELVGRWVLLERVGCVLKSPNGHYWRLEVADDGTLSTTDLGAEVVP